MLSAHGDHDQRIRVGLSLLRIHSNMGSQAWKAAGPGDSWSHDSLRDIVPDMLQFVCTGHGLTILCGRPYERWAMEAREHVHVDDSMRTRAVRSIEGSGTAAHVLCVLMCLGEHVPVDDCMVLSVACRDEHKHR